MTIRNDASPVDVAKGEGIGLSTVNNEMRTPSQVVANERVENVCRILANAGMKFCAPIALRDAREDGRPELANA